MTVSLMGISISPNELIAGPTLSAGNLAHQGTETSANIMRTERLEMFL